MKKNLTLIGFIGLIAASQVSLLLWPVIGVFVNTIVFILLIGLALLHEQVRKLAVVIAIIPAVTMVALILPISDLPLRLGTSYAALFILAAVYKFALVRPVLPVDKKRLHIIAYSVIGILAGVILGVIGSVVLKNIYPFTALPFITVALGAIIFAFTEELFFRGLIQPLASRVLSPYRAVLLVAMLTASLSLTLQSMWFPVMAFVTALALSSLYRSTPSLVATFAMNVTTKLTFVILVGLAII